MLFNFNPDNNFLKNNGIFGLPAESDTSQLHIIPVPWDVTTSYREGTAYAPDAILEASYQIDLFDTALPGEWKKGIYYQQYEDRIMDLNSFERRKSKTIIDFLEHHEDELPERLSRALDEVNKACIQMNEYVAAKVRQCLDAGKIPAVLGGEHSVSFGAIAEVAKSYPGLGILQFDAHADLRNGYLGFTYSHASVMRNAVEQIDGIGKLVQVGIRDLCSDEAHFAANRDGKIDTYYMRAIHDQLFDGVSWKKIVTKIISDLPQNVYITFDIDALEPELCPHTGTPVPAGLKYEEAVYIIAAIQQSGRRIVGFDLMEVAPDTQNQWDETVGSRLLYQLCIHALASQK